MVIKVKYNGEWVKIPYLSSDHGHELVEEAPKDNKQYARQDGTWTVVNIPEVDFTEVYEAIDTKVDKVDGKGLSTNDYITADKTKVTNVNEVIEAAAKSVTATGISITLDKRNLVTNAVENIELDLPASTTALAGLMLPSDKTKLNGIAAGAEVNVNADWNATEGDALILNKPTIPTVDVNKEYVDTQLATKSDLPDYTVCDIVLDILENDSLSISQENYNTLIEKLPNGASRIFPVRDNSTGMSNLLGGIGDNFVYFFGTFQPGLLYNQSAQIFINQDLTVSIDYGTMYLMPSDDGINMAASLEYKSSGINNTKELSIHTTGDGTKSLMDDGKYRKLPVYGKNLLLGSGKEVSNSNYNIANYWLTEQIPNGTQVTVTIWGELGEDVTSFALYNSGGGAGAGVPTPLLVPVNGKASITFNWNIHDSSSVVSNTHLAIFTYPFGGAHTDISTIHKIKLEYGDLSTEWTPAWEDIPDIEERYAYGVEWDMASSSPDGKRVGNMQLHRDLPVQSGMIRCIIDNNGGIVRYNDEAVDDILTQSAMVEIPEHWFKLYTNGTKFKAMFSAIPLPGYNHIDKFYISTMEARIYRNNSTLFSSKGVNSTDSSVRGGDNTAEWDGTYRSLLGRPVTNLTRDQFRQAARKRGSGWEMYTYNAHKILFWLFAVEYATLDSQKPFNAQKDANGFAQGGLGPGPTQMTDWTNFNNTNPLIPCGYTNEFGSGSGEKAYVVKNASDGTHATLMANRYRGIENPFGHIWKYTDGANIQVTTGDSGLSILWTTDDPSNFSDTSYTGYDKKGNICRTSGYAKKMLLGEDGDIVATEIGGSSSTYWCDYYYTYTSANRMQVVRVGCDVGNGSNAGLASVAANSAPSDAYRYLGSRLCFFPKYKSTEITTTTE